MKKVYISCLAAIAILSACTGSKNDNQESVDAAENNSNVAEAITGEWSIENIVVNDSLNARPAETNPDNILQFTFNNDGSFGATTTCNSLGGEYKVNGDSIIFNNVLKTEMACEDMTIETLLAQVINDANSIDMENDSILRINCINDGEYLILKRK